jgi:zinc transporter ZupT
MNRAFSFALLAGGIILIVLGINASNALSSDISRFFTGSPTDKAVWLLAGGVLMAVIGLMGLTRLLRRKPV